LLDRTSQAKTSSRRSSRILRGLHEEAGRRVSMALQEGQQSDDMVVQSGEESDASQSVASSKSFSSRVHIFIIYVMYDSCE